jgi:hypothetical protein
MTVLTPPREAQTNLEREYVDWRTRLNEAIKNEELAEAKIQAEATCERQTVTIQEQDVRLASIHSVITSSLRTALQIAEQKIVARESELCLQKLSDGELLFFLHLTGYRVTKNNVKKPLSLRDICKTLDPGSKPHPETVARRQKELEAKYPGIAKLIISFRAANQKGGGRGGKKKEVSTDGMTTQERRTRKLDDTGGFDDD